MGAACAWSVAYDVGDGSEHACAFGAIAKALAAALRPAVVDRRDEGSDPCPRA
jgi:hypothetical protein